MIRAVDEGRRGSPRYAPYFKTRSGLTRDSLDGSGGTGKENATLLDDCGMTFYQECRNPFFSANYADSVAHAAQKIATTFATDREKHTRYRLA